MLEKEVSDWPGVSKRPMFGYQGLYRDGVIFAALPRSRAMKSPRSLMFKFASMPSAILDSAKKDSRLTQIRARPARVAYVRDRRSLGHQGCPWLAWPRVRSRQKVVVASPPDLLFTSLLEWNHWVPGGGERIVEARYHAQYCN